MSIQEVLIAVAAVLVILMVAHLLGSLILRPVLNDIGSPALRQLLSLVTGIGAIGVLTLLAGITTGYSAKAITGIYLCLGLAAIGYHLLRLRSTPHTALPSPWRQLDRAEKVLVVLLAIHFLLYLLTGFAYPYGSDTFSYVLLAQEYLRLGQIMPMKLEPFLELTPLFKAPCLFEMVYLNLLAMANLVALSLFAKLQFIVTTLLIFFISREIGGSKAGWLAIAMLLTEPIIAYFVGESADNYNISLAFQIASIYFLWLYYRSPRPALLMIAGLLAGTMVAAKLTTCYYLALMLLLMPVLVRISRKAAGISAGWLASLRGSLIFMLPAALLAGLFPILLFLVSGEMIMGLDWTITTPDRVPRETWIYPFFQLEYHPLLRYRHIFEASPDFPVHLAQVKELFSYYLRNPLKVTKYPDWLFSHTPLALALALLLPPVVALARRCDPYLRWLAAVLLGGYLIKLFNFPLIIPPKSEMFQIVPTAMLAAICLSRYFATDWNVTGDGQFSRLACLLRNPARACLLILLPFAIINLYYVGSQYRSLIKTYSFKSQEQIATIYNQKWLRDNLTEKDILFGKIANQICYIHKPEIHQFFWESMLFAPWQRIEQRILATRANYIFDSSQAPEKFLSGYQKILPIIQRRNPSMHARLVAALELYTANYARKTAFLERHFELVHQDATGTVYRKRTIK